MKRYVYFLLIGIWMSCRQQPEEIPVCKEVDVIGCHDSIMRLSALTDTVHYLLLEPAETDSDASYPPRLLSLKKHLAVLFPSEKGSLFNVCQVYKKETGHLSGRISPRRQKLSPEKEWFNFIPSYYVLLTDETGNLLFGRLSIKNKEVYTYYWQTWDLRTVRPVDSVKIASYGWAVPCYFGGGRIAFLHFNYPKHGGGVSKVTLVDKHGKVAGTIPERRTFEIVPGVNYGTYLTDMISYRKENTFRYYNAHQADTIFAITDDLKEYPVYRFICGDKTYPYYYQARVKAKHFEPEKYYAIHLPRESENYLFFQYSYDGKEFYGLYDIRRDHLSVSREDLQAKRFRHSEGGLSNDIDGGLPFWPDIITDEDEMGCVQQVGDIRKRLAFVNDNEMKARPAYRNLSAFIRDLPDESYVVASVRIVR